MNENQIKEDFKLKRKRQLILVPIIVIFGIGGIIGSEQLSNLVGFDIKLIPLLVIVIGLLFSFKNWRCPSCNSYLGKDINPAFCRHCGVKLQD